MLTTERIDYERLKACNEFRQLTGVNYTGKGFPRVPTSWDDLRAIHDAYRVSQEYGDSHSIDHNHSVVRLEEQLWFKQIDGEIADHNSRQRPESPATTTTLSTPISGMTAPVSGFGGTATVTETPASIIQRSMDKRFSNASIAKYVSMLGVKAESGKDWTASSVAHFIKNNCLVEPSDGRIGSKFRAELAAGAGE